MGLLFLRKTFQIDREVANDLRSFRRFLNGNGGTQPDGPAHREVLNRAIRYSLAHDPHLIWLNEVVSNGKKEGSARLDVEIDMENWISLNEYLKMVYGRLNEQRLIEQCLRFYIGCVKARREFI